MIIKLFYLNSMDESQFLTAYEPIDLATIKPCKITSEKDFESESNSIFELLKDISKPCSLNRCDNKVTKSIITSNFAKRVCLF